jgi:glycosyltransferase involved in cell wall biosynthesis
MEANAFPKPRRPNAVADKIPSVAGLRVLHVTQCTTGGVAQAVRSITADQASRGWQCMVASPPEQDLRSSLQGTLIQHVAWPARRSPDLWTPAEVIHLRRLVERTDPDVVHLHSSKAGGAGRLAIAGRRPTIFQPHAWSFAAVSGPLGLATRLWERHAARWAHAVVCVSDDERHEGMAAGITANWTTAPNGVDLDYYRPADAAARSQARRGKGLLHGPLALCVGRICPQKGQDVLIDAWPAVRSRVDGAQLVLVGDGPERERLESRGVDGVLWAGRASDVRDWLSAADVVVLPSRWEGLSYSLLEAMASGRSVVLSAVNGAGLVSAAGAGAVVPVGDARALAEAVSARLLKAELATQEGRAGRRFVEQRHDVRQQLTTIAELTTALAHEALPAPGVGDVDGGQPLDLQR